MIEPPNHESGRQVSRGSGQTGAARSPDSQTVSRRGLLVWLTGGSLALASALAFGQIARLFSFQPAAEAATTIPVGPPDNFSPGSLVYHGASRAYLGRDSVGLYAIDAICTHLGCLVEHEPAGAFVCPCHGSKFGAEGQVQNGPATESLRHLGLQLNQDGQVVVDRNLPVSTSTRLAIPAG